MGCLDGSKRKRCRNVRFYFVFPAVFIYPRSRSSSANCLKEISFEDIHEQFLECTSRSKDNTLRRVSQTGAKENDAKMFVSICFPVSSFIPIWPQPTALKGNILRRHS
ncbi:hypothetical protein AVEN_93484-1 [Araneus ventricosus]|uniref:Uncharacterized protein n=1 Tax=Araneus ventricosus TaxID=182803 RepID=A0A4Y2AQC0_ARAVE|nr:hypothetical protein AVEN_93484-1 [Araneus ventricosus]